VCVGLKDLAVGEACICACHYTIARVEMYLHIFLTIILGGGGWSALRPSHFTLSEKAVDILSVGEWVGPRAGLTDWRREKSFASARN
jgi:hypothetical protein